MNTESNCDVSFAQKKIEFTKREFLQQDVALTILDYSYLAKTTSGDNHECHISCKW